MKVVKNRKFMNLDEFIQKDFKEEPKQVGLYLDETLKEYERERDMQMLIVSLRDVVRAKGVCFIVKKTGLSRQTIYKALSEKGNPTFKTLAVILEALGYAFDFKKLKNA